MCTVRKNGADVVSDAQKADVPAVKRMMGMLRAADVTKGNKQ